MAIQYPSFDADPNAVPQLSKMPTIFEGIQKGIAIGNLPRQLRMQREQAAANLEQTQLQNKYYPLVQQQALDKGAIDLKYLPADYQSRIRGQNNSADLTAQQAAWLPKLDSAQIADYLSRARYTNTQTDTANEDLKTQRAFNALMANGVPDNSQQVQSSSAPQPMPSYIPGSGQAPFAPQAQQAPQSAQSMGAPPSAQSSQDNSGGIQGQVVDQGNPSLYNVDKIAMQYPQYGALLKKYGVNPIKTTTQINDKTGAAVVTTTMPSGKTFVHSVPVSSIQGSIISTPGDQAAYTNAVNDNNAARNVQSQLEQLAHIMNNVDFDNVTGPVNQWLPKIPGMTSDQVSKIYGQFNTTSNDLQATFASTLTKRGATNNALNLAARAKVAPSDTAPVARGKLEALNTGNKWKMDYTEALGRNLHSGMSYFDAAKAAEEQVPFTKYQGEMETYLDEGEAGGKIAKYNENIPKAKQIEMTWKADKFGNELPYVKAQTKTGKHILVPASQYVNEVGLQ